jgi:hypothetical protein
MTNNAIASAAIALCTAALLPLHEAVRNRVAPTVAATDIGGTVTGPKGPESRRVGHRRDE